MRHRTGHRTGTGRTPAPAELRRLLALGLVLAMAAVAPAAAADDDEDADLYSQSGFYLTALGLGAIPTEKGDLKDQADQILGETADTDVDNSFGASGRFGYRLTPRFAVEAQFDWLNSIELDSDIMGSGEQKSEISLFTLTGNAKAYLLTGRFQPYLVAGAGWARSRLDPAGPGSKTRDDGFSTRLGAGLDIYGSPDVALSTEVGYSLQTGSVEDLDYLSIGVGLTLRFYGE